MYKVTLRKNNRIKRKMKLKSIIRDTVERPRVSVFRSNRYIYAQVIDDVSKKTLCNISSAVLVAEGKLNKTQQSIELGKVLAKKVLDLKVKTVVFDRNGYRYHGRVKALADGAREGGLIL